MACSWVLARVDRLKRNRGMGGWLGLRRRESLSNRKNLLFVHKAKNEKYSLGKAQRRKEKKCL